MEHPDAAADATTDAQDPRQPQTEPEPRRAGVAGIIQTPNGPITLTARGDNVVVEPVIAPEKVGDIHVPEGFQAALARRTGKVVAVGPEVEGLEPGMTVVLTAGMDFVVDYSRGTPHLVTSQKHCVCIVDAPFLETAREIRDREADDLSAVEAKSLRLNRE